LNDQKGTLFTFHLSRPRKKEELEANPTAGTVKQVFPSKKNNTAILTNELFPFREKKLVEVYSGEDKRI
jgi:hypothetical protein